MNSEQKEVVLKIIESLTYEQKIQFLEYISKQV